MNDVDIETPLTFLAAIFAVVWGDGEFDEAEQDVTKLLLNRCSVFDKARRQGILDILIEPACALVNDIGWIVTLEKARDTLTPIEKKSCLIWACDMVAVKPVIAPEDADRLGKLAAILGQELPDVENILRSAKTRYLTF